MKKVLCLLAILLPCAAWGQGLPANTSAIGCLNSQAAIGTNAYGVVRCDASGNLLTNSGIPGSSLVRGTGTPRSLVVGTTAQVLMPANALRSGWKIKNDSSGDVWINFDSVATATPGNGNVRIVAGGYLASEPAFVETGAISIIGSAANLSISAREQ